MISAAFVAAFARSSECRFMATAEFCVVGGQDRVLTFHRTSQIELLKTFSMSDLERLRGYNLRHHGIGPSNASGTL